MEIKCELCGKQIVVGDDIVSGQHVRCPFCGEKFSYGVKNPPEQHVPSQAKNREFAKKATSESLMEKKAKRLKARIEKESETTTRKKTATRRTIVLAASILITMATMAILYLNWREKKGQEISRIAKAESQRVAIATELRQNRENLRQYIAAQTRDLRRRMSDVISEINDVSRLMRDKRDAGEDVSDLKAQKKMLREKQDAIQPVLNAFISAGMSVDMMNSTELDTNKSELTAKAHDLNLKIQSLIPAEPKVTEKKIEQRKLPKESIVQQGEMSHDLTMQNEKSEQNQPLSNQAVPTIAPANIQQQEEDEKRPVEKAEDVKENEEGDESSIAKPKNEQNEDKTNVRKCYKCFGKGTITETKREKCVDCDGRGFLMKEVILKDTKYSTDGYWNYKRIGNRVSKSRENCSRCRHSGKVSVKRENKCSVCKGSGFLTKDGKPFRDTSEEIQESSRLVSQWLIPTAEDKGTIWHYLKFKPEQSWTDINYDHSKWLDGMSAFVGKNGSLKIGTDWNSQDIYLRKRFLFNGTPSKIKIAKLRFTIDDTLQIWLNGEKVTEQSGVTERYREVEITNELRRWLHQGENVIAAWAHDCCGRRNVDLGLYIEYLK